MKRTAARLTAVMLSLAMLILLLPSAVFAAGTAKIGSDEYATIQQAIDSTTGDQTIELTADTAESITIPEGRTITLILGGFTLSESSGDTISNKGTLIITGTGSVTNSTNGKGALVNYPGATATLKGGSFTADKWYTIKNLGTMTIDSDVKVYTETGSSSLIANGWYGNAATDRNTSYSGVQALLTIRGGEFIGGMNTVKNDDGGRLVIENGSFSNSTGPTILNWNITQIYGGIFSVPSGYVLANGYFDNNGADEGKMTIYNGLFTSGNGGTDYLLGYGVGGSEGGEIVINGGAFVGKTDIGEDTPYKLSIIGGMFTAAVDPEYIDEDATVALATYDEENVYVIGGQEMLAEILAVAEQGFVITVLKGDLTLSDVAVGVTVKNQGGGTVLVNGQNVTDSITVEESYDTADNSMLIYVGILVLALCLAAVLRGFRVKRMSR